MDFTYKQGESSKKRLMDKEKSVKAVTEISES